MRYCSACGTLNDTDAKFCAGCGKQLGVDIVEEVKKPEEPEEKAAENVQDTQEIPIPAVMLQKEPEQFQADPIEVRIDPAPVQPAAEPEKKPDHRVKGRVFGIIGFALGIEALICCWMPYVNFITLIEAIIGLIFCGISKKNTDFKLARVGKTLNLIALIFSIVTIILYIVLIVIFLVNYGPELSEAISEATDGVVNIYFGY